jgi:hypothetical protein
MCPSHLTNVSRVIFVTNTVAPTHRTWAHFWHLCKGCHGVITDWTSRKHEEYWQSSHDGQRRSKGFHKTPSAKRAEELLSLSQNQLRISTGQLTGHCHLKGLYSIPSVTVQTGNWKVLACSLWLWSNFRFRHLDQNFMRPGDFEDISVSRIMHFVQSARLYKGSKSVAVPGSLWCPPLYILFYSVLFYSILFYHTLLLSTRSITVQFDHHAWKFQWTKRSRMSVILVIIQGGSNMTGTICV